MLKVEHLSVEYSHISAVNDISIHVPEGKIVSLIGANGAGKSSTLMAISGLADKAEGQVTFAGEDITFAKADHIAKCGIAHVPEGRLVFPKLSVYENLVMGTCAAEKMGKKEIAELAEKQFELFPRLKERIRQPAGTLSGGEQQMVAIARGLMGKPRLLMLDEPSLGLAPIVVEEIFRLICRIKEEGMTVLLIEQNAAMALQICDYCYALELGRITVQGTGRELLGNDDIRKAYLGM